MKSPSVVVVLTTFVLILVVSESVVLGARLYDPVLAGLQFTQTVLAIAVAVAARQAKESIEREVESAAKRSSDVLGWEKAVLVLARKHNGVLSIPTVATESELTIPDAEAVLAQLTAQGYARPEVRADGAVEYYFPSLSADVQGSVAR